VAVFRFGLRDLPDDQHVRPAEPRPENRSHGIPSRGPDRGEIDPRGGSARVAELFPLAGLVYRPGRAEQGLARGAAEVDAGASGQVPLGQGDGVPGLGGGDRGRQAGRAAPITTNSYMSLRRGGRQSVAWP
jgi:hypothetical protein